MRLLTVYPIARGAKIQELSYFTSLEVPVGAVVTVPLRSRSVPAIVTASSEVAEQKSTLRSAEYSVKRITARTYKTLFSTSFVRAAERISEYYGASMGETLFALTPQKLLESLLKKTSDMPEIPHNPESNTMAEKRLLHAPLNERVDEYRNVVREAFAQSRSVYILTPTISSAEHLSKELSRGIREYVWCFHGGLNKKKLHESWSAALSETHPILVIGTGSFLGIPRSDISTYIVEHEQSSAYRAQARPFLDYRRFVEYLADASGARIVLADLPVRIETFARFEEHEIEEHKVVKSRSLSSAKVALIDMRKEQKENARKSAFVLSDELLEALTDVVARKERAFLYTARRGLAPITVCGDCGSVVRCAVCDAGVVLHKGAKNNLFVCHACGSVRGAGEKCASCTSWKLTTLGVGATLVEDTVAELFPDAALFAIDRDSVRSHTQAARIAEEFYKTPGSILVGTEMALPYLQTPLPLTAVTSIDALLSLPEWNVYERIFGTLSRIREYTEGQMYIQTRSPEQPILDQAARGLISDFYRSELEMRKRFSYPPYSTLIKLSVEGTPQGVTKSMKELEEHLAPFGFSGTTHLMKKSNNRHSMHGFIRREKERWPDMELLGALRALPPSVSIMIDPNSVL